MFIFRNTKSQKEKITDKVTAKPDAPKALSGMIRENIDIITNIIKCYHRHKTLDRLGRDINTYMWFSNNKNNPEVKKWLIKAGIPEVELE